MSAASSWRRLRPLLFATAVVAATSSCAGSQMPVGQLREGVYDCVAVFVNQSKKYELYVDDAGREYTGFARVQDGKVTSYSAPNALGWRDDVEIVVRKSASTRFHATQDPAVHSYDALACEWSKEG